MNRRPASPRLKVPRRVLAAGLLVGALGAAAPAGAVDFHNASGTLTGSWDTTLSIGEAWRAAKPDPALIGTADGGSAQSPNTDRGDANYRSGQPFSQVFKLTSELSLKFQNFGAFARGALLYDEQVMSGHTESTPISKAAKDVAGHYTRLLDAFAYGKFDLGANHPLELRLGKQLLSWGESLVIQGGLTAVNAVDLAALRAPGSELKEGFLPQQMARMTLGLSKHVNLEAFYMLEWRPTILEPVGTYFSTNNSIPAGGNYAFLGFGAYSNQGTDFRPLGGPFIPSFQGVPRSADVTPNKNGQFGVALRWFAPDLGNGTDFGLYFQDYASRTPLFSARTGTPAGIGNAAGAATAVAAAAQATGLALAAGLPPAAAVAVGVHAGTQYGQAAAAQAGGSISTATLASYAAIGANVYLGSGGGAAGEAAVAYEANALATNEYAQTASYFAEYPEHLRTIGLSFNTQLGASGVTLQGELSYRNNTPLQYDDVEVLFAALTPLERALFPLSAPGVPFPSGCAGAPLNTLARCGQLGGYAPGQVVTGWGRYNVWQAQVLATKSLPPVLGAQQAVLVGEVGITDVPGLPNKAQGGPNGRGLRFEAPGTNVSGNGALASYQLNLVEPQSAFPSHYSWGYVLIGKLDYPGLVGPWNVSPRLVWQHDVSGVSPVAGGFLQGRHALLLGATASLANRWELDLSYTQNGGAGHYNLLRDRAYVAAVVKFSF
jgi:hypothetical protein